MRTLFILCLFLLSGRFFAQSQTELKAYEDIYMNLEEKAKPDYNWLEYLNQNLNYPEAALKNNIQGKVRVEFIVEKDGSISQSRIIRGKEIGYGIPEEALRLVNNMPKWKPGRQKNQPVRSYFTLPISFSLPQEPRLAELKSTVPDLNGASPENQAEKAGKIDENTIYRAVQTKPEPTFNTSRFLAKNLEYPEEARQNEIWGKVVVQFVVERDGSLSDIRVLRGKELGHGIPQEAIRVISIMPKWKPAMHSGKLVRSYFTMPVEFKLQ